MVGAMKGVPSSCRLVRGGNMYTLQAAAYHVKVSARHDDGEVGEFGW